MANLNEFSTSLATTRKWIDDLMDTLEKDEVKACRILRATLHELRDHLTVEEIADLSAQFPLLLRGLWFEGWRPGVEKKKRRSKAEFLERVRDELPELTPESVEKVVRDVFDFLAFKVSEGEIRHIVSSLPRELKDLWPAGAGVPARAAFQ